MEDSELEEMGPASQPYLDDLLRTALRLSGDEARAGRLVRETYLRARRSNCSPGQGPSLARLYQILFQVIQAPYRQTGELLPGGGTPRPTRAGAAALRSTVGSNAVVFGGSIYEEEGEEHGIEKDHDD